MGVEFRPLKEKEREDLARALRSNVEEGKSMFMDLQTGWSPSADEITDNEVIDAIKSVSAHY